MTLSVNKNAYGIVQSMFSKILWAETGLNEDAETRLLTIGCAIPETEDRIIEKASLSDNRLPDLEKYPDQYFDGILVKTTLFQLKNPLSFFEQALRLLKPGARLIMLEPAISITSWAYYKYCTDFDVNMGIDPFQLADDTTFQKRNRPNLAYPTLLFTRQEHRIQFMERFPEFHLIKRKWVGMIADPLSLGKSRYSLIPAASVPAIFDLEDILNPFLGRWLSNKMLITLEKRK